MERAKFARVDKLVTALSCPLCFEVVKNCVVTPCGHSFCRSCAGDAVTRKHCCPVCQMGVIGGETGLIRNFLVDEVAEALRKATEDTDVAYMRLLFDRAANAGGDGSGGSVAGAGKGRETNDHAHGQASDPRSVNTLLPVPPDLDGDDGILKSSVTQPVMPHQEHQHQHRHQRQQHLMDVEQTENSHRKRRQEAGSSPSLKPPPALDLSPVEAVLINRMREAFLGYQSYYAHERAAHNAEIRDLKAQLLAAQSERMPVVAATESIGNAMKVKALEGAIADSEARFKAGMAALLKDFDAHAAAAAPPPSLLPSTVSVILASRSVRFDTQLLPTHFPEDVYNKVRAFYLASGDKVRGFGPNTRLYLQPLSSKNATDTGGVNATAAASACAEERGAPERQSQQRQKHQISDATKSVFSQSPAGRIGVGWALVVDGKVLLESEEMKPCFAVEFAQQQQLLKSDEKKGGLEVKEGGRGGGGGGGQQQPQRVDYFMCGDCKLNWLCAACAAHCHSGCRGVKPFMLNHLPTWACCYCSRKKSRGLGCKLTAAATAGGKSTVGVGKT